MSAVYSSYSENVEILSVPDFRSVHRPATPPLVRDAMLDRTGKRLATRSSEAVRLWNVSSGRELAIAAGTYMSFSKDGGRLATVYGDAVTVMGRDSRISNWPAAKTSCVSKRCLSKRERYSCCDWI